MGQAPMETLAMGRQFPLFLCFAPPGGTIALAVLPFQAVLAVPFDPPTLVVVGRIVGPQLPIHLSLQPPDRGGIGREFRAQQVQAGRTLPGHDGYGGRPQVKSHGVAAESVLGLLVRDARERQLDEIAMALAVCPVCSRATRLALNQPGVFHAMRQAVGDHRIVPVDQGWQLVPLPQQISRVPLLGALEDKVQARIVALVLHTPQASSLALEAHPSCLTQAHAIEGTIGTAG
jgi:hypothetical protein